MCLLVFGIGYIFYIVQAGYYSHVRYGISWLDTRNLVSQHWSEDYLFAFYFSTVTMFTVGYGDITP